MQLPVFRFNYFNSAVRGKDRVQSLLFLGRVTGIVISLFPEYMVGILSGKTAPCPEVASGKESAALTILADEVEYITVIFIAGSGRRLFGETEAVTGKTELLQNNRLAVLPGNDHVVIYILLSILLGTRKKFRQAVSLHPAPVVGPDGKWFIDTNKVPSQALYETGAFKYGPGDVKYKDLDGNGEITYGEQTLEDHGDLKRIGNTLPNFEYGFSVALTYKDFDFSTFFQGIGSRDVWAVGQTGIPGFMPGEGWLEHQMDYWTPENTDAFYPTPTSHSWINNGQNFLRQTRYLQNMSYLRCKNITLGYTVPEKWMKVITFTSGRIYVSAENLFEFDHTNIPVDPETTEKAAASNGEYKFGKSYPFMRSISFGVQLTF